MWIQKEPSQLSRSLRLNPNLKVWKLSLLIKQLPYNPYSISSKWLMAAREKHLYYTNTINHIVLGICCKKLTRQKPTNLSQQPDSKKYLYTLYKIYLTFRVIPHFLRCKRFHNRFKVFTYTSNQDTYLSTLKMFIQILNFKKTDWKNWCTFLSEFNYGDPKGIRFENV